MWITNPVYNTGMTIANPLYNTGICDEITDPVKASELHNPLHAELSSQPKGGDIAKQKQDEDKCNDNICEHI